MKRSCAFAAFACLLAGGPASAAEPPLVESTPLKFGSLSFMTENDKYFAGTDRNYTNGFKASVLTRDLVALDRTRLPAPLGWVSRQVRRFIDDGDQAKVGLSFGQNMYTPTDTTASALLPDDRPYAAWLYLGAAFHDYGVPVRLGGGATRARLDVFEVNLGMVGPSALGRQVQNLVHDLIGVARSNGWDNQIDDEPGLNLIYERKWRYSTDGDAAGWGVDAIPRVGASLGNVFTYANAGLELRAGWALPRDFGTSLIRPSGDSNPAARPGFTAFVFLSSEVRAVARDITLDGNTFRDSHSIDREWFVHDLAGGVGLGFAAFQLTYTQARRSKEFVGQEEPQDFGSINVTFFF